MSDEMKEKSWVVFVYGSLKRGFGNHRLLERGGARFLGEASAHGFTMHNLGAFPGIIRNGDGIIKGELYEVNAGTLARLDQLEGHPSFYRREDIVLDNGQTVQGYVLPPSGYYTTTPQVLDGEWK